MMKKKAKAKPELPKFGSVEEAAQFFDTHSVVDFIDESAEKGEGAGADSDQGILVPLRLDAETYAALRGLARELHLSPVSVARRILVERLCPPQQK